MIGEKHFKVTLDRFEGPLDILLFIVEKNRFDIKNLPLSDIIDQYLSYIQQMKEPNIASESHYMMITSRLIRMKAKMLLKGEDNKEVEVMKKEFGELLETYRYVKEVAEFLAEKKRMYWDYFPSWRAQVGYVEDLNYSVVDIVRAFERIILRATVEDGERYVPADPLDIKARLMELIDTFRKKKSEFFRGLLSPSPSVKEILEVFLAILELFKRGAVRVIQKDPDEDLLIVSTPLIHRCRGLQEVSI